MHINWTTTVQFPEYPNSQHQDALRLRIAEATDDDLLVAYLHWIEGRVALDFIVAASDLAAKTQSEQHHLETLIAPLGTPFTLNYNQAHGALRLVLNRTSTTASNAVQQAQRVWRKLREQTSRDLTNRYRDAADPALSDLESIGTLKEQVAKAELDVRKALAKHRNEMHSLSLLEQEMELFLASDDSVALEDIHGMTPTAFERIIAALARRDGHHIIRDSGGARDLGADVIVLTPDRLRVVFQCKHRQAGLGKVGSPDVQTLNGTARPEHKADIVVAVTNGTFTKPATDFARAHDIHLLDQARLKRWATWGEPLLSVLDIAWAGPHSATAS
ncbi:restriction endonuclease [Streptomyces antimycoticus]